MKEILFICPIALNENDAPSLHVTQLSDEFQNTGFNVTVFAPGFSKLRGKHMFSVFYIYSFKKFISLTYQPFLSLLLVYFILKKKPAFVYFRISPFLVLPLIITKILRTTLVAEVNGVQNDEMKLLGGPILKLLASLNIFWITEHISYFLSNNIICVTDGVSEYVRKNYNVPKDKISVVNNGVNDNLFRPLKNSEQASEYKASKNSILVGYVGGLHKWQGIDFLLEALAICNKSTNSINLVIAGSGDQDFELRQKCADLNLFDSVTFLGAVDHENIPALINTFDICISYPTKVRSGVTSPFKIYEYLSCGKATIVSNIKGVGDIFDKVCLVSKAENSEDLANSINKLANNPNLRIDLGKKARNYILNEHTWSQTANQILSHIGKLA